MDEHPENSAAESGSPEEESASAGHGLPQDPPARRLSPIAQVAWVAAVALLAGGALLLRLPGHAADAAPPAGSGAPAKVGGFRPSAEQWKTLKLITLGPRRFETTIDADGQIAADDEHSVQVFSPYSGRITGLAARLGDHVQAGQILMSLAGSEQAQGLADLRTSHAALLAAQEQLHQAIATEQRQHDLFDADAAAQKDWTQARTDLANARSALAASLAADAAARQRLRILGHGDAEIDAMQAAGSEAAANEAPVRSPIDGVVVQRNVGPGQYVVSAAGGAGTPAFVIADPSRVWLVAAVPEQDAAWLRVGAPVEVRVAALGGQQFSARIAWIAAALDPATHRLPVRAVLANPAGALKPQMLAHFTIAGGDASEAIAVPESAVIYEGDQARVWVAAPDGQLQSRSIRAGRRNGDLIEVLAGLAAGEKIVGSGTLFIDRAAQGED